MILLQSWARRSQPLFARKFFFGKERVGMIMPTTDSYYYNNPYCAHYYSTLATKIDEPRDWFTNDRLLLHHTLMYSKESLVTEYAKRIEDDLASLDTVTPNQISISRLLQHLELRSILVGVHLLSANLDQAQFNMKQAKKLALLLHQRNSSHEKHKDHLEEEVFLFYNSVKYWFDGDIETSLSYHEELIKKYPRNMFGIFFGYQHAIVLYRINWLCDMFDNYIMKSFSCYTSPTRSVMSFNSDERRYERDSFDSFDFQFGHYVKAMYCFVLEEMHRMEEAESYGIEAEEHFNEFAQKTRQVEAMKGKFACPWVHHSLCHIYHTNGRFSEGIEFMEQRKEHWKQCNSFLQTHNFWHLALLYISRSHEGDVQRCLELYKQHVWIDRSADESAIDNGEMISWKEDAGVQCGAINLLWKLDMKYQQEQQQYHNRTDLIDPSLNGLWDEIYEYSKELIEKHLSGYVDFHYAYLIARNYALKGNNSKELSEFQKGLINEVYGGKEHVKGVYRRMVIPLSKGIILFMQHKFKDAYEVMKPVFDQEVTRKNLGSRFLKHNGLGGSQAQREVLGDLWIQVLLLNGKWKEAKEALEERHDSPDHCANRNHQKTMTMAYISELQLRQVQEELKEIKGYARSATSAWDTTSPPPPPLEKENKERELPHRFVPGMKRKLSRVSGESEDTIPTKRQ